MYLLSVPKHTKRYLSMYTVVSFGRLYSETAAHYRALPLIHNLVRVYDGQRGKHADVGNAYMERFHQPNSQWITRI